MQCWKVQSSSFCPHRWLTNSQLNTSSSFLLSAELKLRPCLKVICSLAQNFQLIILQARVSNFTLLYTPIDFGQAPQGPSYCESTNERPWSLTCQVSSGQSGAFKGHARVAAGLPGRQGGIQHDSSHFWRHLTSLFLSFTTSAFWQQSPLNLVDVQAPSN